ncbi:hypothetical protein ARTHRO9AX_20284 [Arthrobacter sp. 9AX]|nr:hypothetical protein ARTHRO9AX_20284 [Arthrobacter sp. 9AX]
MAQSSAALPAGLGGSSRLACPGARCLAGGALRGGFGSCFAGRGLGRAGFFRARFSSARFCRGRSVPGFCGGRLGSRRLGRGSFAGRGPAGRGPGPGSLGFRGFAGGSLLARGLCVCVVVLVGLRGLRFVPGPARSSSAPALPVQASLQRLHQVDDLALAALTGLHTKRFLSVQRVALLEFGLDELAELHLVVIGEVLGVEVSRHGFHEGGGHLTLLWGDLDGHIQGRKAGFAHFIRPEQGLEHQDVVLDAQRTQPGLLPQRELDDRHPVRVLQGAAEQHVGLGRLGVRLQVIALLEHHRFKLLGRDELHHFDLVAVLGGDGFEFVLGEDHRLAVFLVGLLNVRVVDHLAAYLAPALVPDAATVGVVDLVQTDVMIFGCAVNLYGYVDQAKRDGTFPDGSHPLSQQHGAPEVKTCGRS